MPHSDVIPSAPPCQLIRSIGAGRRGTNHPRIVSLMASCPTSTSVITTGAHWDPSAMFLATSNNRSDGIRRHLVAHRAGRERDSDSGIGRRCVRRSSRRTAATLLSQRALWLGPSTCDWPRGRPPWEPQVHRLSSSFQRRGSADSTRWTNLCRYANVCSVRYKRKSPASRHGGGVSRTVRAWTRASCGRSDQQHDEGPRHPRSDIRIRETSGAASPASRFPHLPASSPSKPDIADDIRLPRGYWIAVRARLRRHGARRASV